jgi:hypothetical protein
MLDTPARPAPSTKGRFWPKVDQHGPMASPFLGPCWLWTRAKNRDGYGQFSLARRIVRAHRVAYELVCGPVPMGWSSTTCVDVVPASIPPTWSR